MTIDSKGILHRSYMGQCANYDPDITKPTGVKAHDVLGLIIYECLNCSQTPEGVARGHNCGGIEYCLNHKPKTDL